MAARHSFLTRLSRVRLRRTWWTAAVLTSCLLGAAPVLADEPAPPVPEPSATPAKTPWKGPAKAKAKPLSVKLTVTANSPDPPWLLRIENAGDTRIRVPADSRLLSFDLRTAKNGAVKKCKPPRAMIPQEFPEKRELFLEPGEFYEEEIDPRVFCFGDSTLLLKPGTMLIPHFGFGPSFGGPTKEPFAAQASDRHDVHDPLQQIVGEQITLPPVPKPPPPPVFASPPTNGSPAAAADSAPDAKSTPKAALSDAPPAGNGADADDELPPPPRAPVDDNAGHLDIYLTERMDAPASRDIALTIDAVNEGKRQLTTVLRGRMLHFRVEQLGADNRVIGHTECVHQEGAHGIATEMVSKVKPGKRLTIPLLVAEVCPRGTFPRPGLYRVIPRLDTSQEGEILKHDPWLGTALAMQSALVRLASARDDFYFSPPRSGPAKLPAGLVVATDPPKKAPPKP